MGQIIAILDEYNKKLPVKFQTFEEKDLYFLSDHLSNDKRSLLIDIGDEEHYVGEEP